MSRQATFRGLTVTVVSDRVKDRKPDLHYYELRQGGDAWASPATLEPQVNVRFGGTVISKTSIELGEDGYLELSDEESVLLLGEAASSSSENEDEAA